jgi:hypothetical protein
MPGSMPGHTAKGAILAKLDEALNDLGPDGNRAQFLQRISAKRNGAWKEGLVDVAAELLKLDDTEVRHLRKDWFDPQGGWWLKQQPIEIVVRLGLIHAIQLADGKIGLDGTESSGDGKVRAVDFYWVCGVNDFELASCVSDDQVTTLFITPGRPASDRLAGNYTGMEPIFTTRHTSLTPGEKLLEKPIEHVEFVQMRRER